MVTCRLPAGIGTNLDVIYVQEYPKDSGIERLKSVLEGGFSYYPPFIEMIVPAAADALGDSLEITGREFGSVASSVEIFMGNVTCTDASLAFRTYGAGSVAILQCETEQTTVGERPLVVNVAGKTAQ